MAGMSYQEMQPWLAANGSTSTRSGTIEADTRVTHKEIERIHAEMQMYREEARYEKQRRREVEERMRIQNTGSGYMTVDPAIFQNVYYHTAPPPPVTKAPHRCLTKQNERHRAYQKGIVDFHRKKGVDLKKFESECDEPACVLARIKSKT